MTVEPTPPERREAYPGVVGAAKVWADTLIDKTGRNELLYCKDRGKIRLDDADPGAVARLLNGDPVRLRQLFRDETVFQSVAKTAESIRRRIKEYDEERGVRIGRIVYGFATWEEVFTRRDWSGRTRRTGPQSTAPVTPALDAPVAPDHDGFERNASTVERSMDDDAFVGELVDVGAAVDNAAAVDDPAGGAAVDDPAVGAAMSDGPARRLVRAPVLLRDISVTRRPGRDDFDLRADRDLEISPVLLHYLRSRFRIEIDQDLIADLNDIVDDPERISEVLDKLGGLLIDAPDFRIMPGVLIGTFHYAKLAMHQDLIDNADAFADNDLVGAMSGDLGAIERIRRPVGEVTMDQPDRTPPADEFLVLDADPSQNYVINAALAGRNLIVQGPPGTGKSQTISNLIATFAAHGRTVLFVAEKRAAIDAVLGRLSEAGLADLTLDLHVTTANRAKVYEQFRSVIEGSRSADDTDQTRLHVRLDRTRAILMEHDAAMHTPREPWRASVYELQAATLGTPAEARNDVRLTAASLDALDGDRADEIRRALTEFVTVGGLRPPHARGPWSIARFESDTAATQAREAVAKLQTWVPELRRQSAAVAAAFRFGEPPTPGDANAMIRICQRTAAVAARWRPEIYDQDLPRLIVAASGRHATMPNGESIGWWERSRLCRQARRLLLPGARGQAALIDGKRVDLADDLREVASVAAAWWRISRVRPPAQPDLSGAVTANDTTRALLGELDALLAAGELTTRDWASLMSLLDALAREPNAAHSAARINRLAAQVRAAGATDLLDWLDRVGPTWPEDRRAHLATAAFDHMWQRAALDRVTLADAHLASFDGAAHSAVADDFIATDHQHAEANRHRVRRRVAERLTDVRTRHLDQDLYLSRELTRKRGLKPLRDLMREAPDVLLAAKPCWAMSPLLVSQLLPPAELFDVVIFDEASQVQPAEAIPSIARARSAVIAGDSKQLPPTAFFEAAVDSEDDADRDLLTQDAESVLEAFNRALGHAVANQYYLGWHYRSQDARLIAPSNAFFYDNRMVTFPGTAVESPIRFVEVTEAESADGTSAQEVRRVVDLIIEHARERPSESLGVITMGITHANRIEDALHRRLRTERDVLDWFDADGPEPYFIKNLERVQGDERDAIILAVGYGKSRGRMMHRFGPLNNAGGQRRLNVAITRAKRHMTVVAGFNPDELDPSKLNSEGARRLADFLRYAAEGTPASASASVAVPASSSASASVAVPAASSVAASVAPVSASIVAPVAASVSAPVEFGLTPFETQVRDRLAADGIHVRCRVGVAGYFIDFAATHPTQPDRMVLAIETDGPTYHAAPTTRSRDRLRQEQLERLGWRFHRLWLTDWLRTPDRALAKIRAAFEEAVYAADHPNATHVVTAAPPVAPWPANRGVAGDTVWEGRGAAEANAVPPNSWSMSGAVLASPWPTPTFVDTPRRRGTRPPVGFGAKIAEYTDDDLVAITEWIASDGLLRTDYELKQEARDELGLRRNGSRIDRRLSAAVDEVRRRRGGFHDGG